MARRSRLPVATDGDLLAADRRAAQGADDALGVHRGDLHQGEVLGDADRALHGAAKALNVIVGLFAIPAWLIGQRAAVPLRRALLEHGKRQALPVPSHGERSMGALMDELE